MHRVARPAPELFTGPAARTRVPEKTSRYGFSTGSLTAFPHSVQEPS